MATRRKKTSKELKAEAQKLLKKARELERKEREKMTLNIGKWVLKNQDKIKAILPPDLAAEFADLLPKKT